jgi:hypothetical protein
MISYSLLQGTRASSSGWMSFITEPGKFARSPYPKRRTLVAQYVHFGIFLITVPNLIVIILMLLVFALAVAVPLPLGHAEPADQVSNQPGEHQEGGV